MCLQYSKVTFTQVKNESAFSSTVVVQVVPAPLYKTQPQCFADVRQLLLRSVKRNTSLGDGGGLSRTPRSVQLDLQVDKEKRNCQLKENFVPNACLTYNSDPWVVFNMVVLEFFKKGRFGS